MGYPKGKLRTKKKKLKPLRPTDKKWKIPSDSVGDEICLLLTNDNRQPIAINRTLTEKEASRRNEWCPYRGRCLDIAAQHAIGTELPGIPGMESWVCSNACPYRQEGEPPQFDPWMRKKHAEPSTTIKQATEVAYAILQALAQQETRSAQ